MCLGKHCRHLYTKVDSVIQIQQLGTAQMSICWHFIKQCGILVQRNYSLHMLQHRCALGNLF